MPNLVGTTRSSYQSIGNARVIVRHNAPVDESLIGARGRNIKEIFVENEAGERVRMPASLLPGARAMARHVASGGEFHDDTGTHIMGLVREWRNLRAVNGFIRENSRSVADLGQAHQYRESASGRMGQIVETLRRLSGARGYSKTLESLTEETVEADASEIDKKVKQIMDVLGVEEGNEPFMEGLRSLARHSLTGGDAVESLGEDLDEAAARPVEPSLDDDDTIDPVLHLKHPNPEIRKRAAKLAKELENDEASREKAKGDLSVVLDDLMGNPAKLDFNPQRLLFASGTTQQTHSHGTEPPKVFKNTMDEIMIKLGALSQAVTDDALSLYLSRIHEKLEHKQPLADDEKKHMARALTIAAKADSRLKITTIKPKAPAKKPAVESVRSVTEATEVEHTGLHGEMFASLASWFEGFAPERILAESFTPSDFASPVTNRNKDRFEAGDTVKLVPTPEINRKALPEANWLKEATTVTLKTPVVKGTMDLVEVELEDGTVKKVYGFNVADTGSRNEAVKEAAPAVSTTAALAEDVLSEEALWDEAAALVKDRGDAMVVQATAVRLGEASFGRVLSHIEALWEGGVADVIRQHLGEDVSVAPAEDLVDDEHDIATALDGLSGETGTVIRISDVGDLLAAEQVIQNAGLPFETDANNTRLMFDTAEDAQAAGDLLDEEGIPHSVDEGLDHEDSLDDAEAFDGEFDLDEDTTDLLGGDMVDDLTADVSRQARAGIDDQGNVAAIHSDEHVLHMGSDGNARRAMQVLDDAGIDYTAYGHGRFEFRTADDLTAAESELAAAGIEPDATLEGHDSVAFMSEMRRKIIDLMI